MPIRSLLESAPEAVTCLWFGQKGGLEERLCPEGVKFVAIEAGKMRREGTIGAILKSIR